MSILRKQNLSEKVSASLFKVTLSDRSIELFVKVSVDFPGDFCYVVIVTNDRNGRNPTFTGTIDNFQTLDSAVEFFNSEIGI